MNNFQIPLHLFEHAIADYLLTCSMVGWSYNKCLNRNPCKHAMTPSGPASRRIVARLDEGKVATRPQAAHKQTRIQSPFYESAGKGFYIFFSPSHDSLRASTKSKLLSLSTRLINSE